MDPLKISIADAWDRGVADYDDLVAHGRLTRTEADAWKAVLGRALPPLSGQAPRRVLEVGAGTGVMSLLIAELGYQLTAIDISRGMLQEARRKAAQRRLPITFEIADAEVLPFPDDEFDAVFGRHILWTLPQPDKALREWHRVLRPGGALVLVDSLAVRPNTAARLRRAISRLLATLQPSGGGHRYGPGVRESLPLAGNHDPDRYSELIRSAGFSQVRAETLDQLTAMERNAMPLVERWHGEERKYLFTARRD
ncbi:MAG TPA: methyltransferase domain-containing protein [Candidatus Dormibacteraeota bacterium]